MRHDRSTLQPNVRTVARRELLRAASLAGAAVSLPALFAKAADAGAYGNFLNHPKWRFVFVAPQTANPFWAPVQYGMADACALLGCTYQFTGSKAADVAEMVNEVNAAIAAKADGIGVSIVDPKAFDAPIDRALAAGIPVTSFNADGGPHGRKHRLAYIGQDLEVSGFKMGQRIAEMIPAGDVVIFISVPGQLNTQPRVTGAEAAIKASGKPIKVTVVGTGVNLDERYSRIEAFYLGHKTLKGMFAVDSGSTNGIGKTMKKYGLAAKGIRGGGFDLVPGTLTAIKSGDLDFTIDQQPYLQGFYQVVQLFLFNLSGGLLAPSDTNTGLKFVTKGNVDAYLSTQTRFEGSASEQKIVPRSGPIVAQ